MEVEKVRDGLIAQTIKDIAKRASDDQTERRTCQPVRSLPQPDQQPCHDHGSKCDQTPPGYDPAEHTEADPIVQNPHEVEKGQNLDPVLKRRGVQGKSLGALINTKRGDGAKPTENAAVHATAFRSARASRMIAHDECRNSPAIPNATIRSGQALPSQTTSPAA